MVLSSRQQQAEALAREIARMGGWVTNSLPLSDTANLRFQVLDANRDTIIAKLASWDWAPVPVSIQPRITQGGWQPASIYEIQIEAPRQLVADDRMIQREPAIKTEKFSLEVEQVLRYLGRK
jgi:hypothetical protein